MIIKEVRPPQPPPPPPLVVRQRAPPLPQPPPLVLREKPPPIPAAVGAQTGKKTEIFEFHHLFNLLYSYSEVGCSSRSTSFSHHRTITTTSAETS